MLGDRWFDRAAEIAADQPAVLPRLPALDRILVKAPSLVRAVESARAPYFVAQRSILKRDYLDREARNSSLGKAGEEFVLAFEQQRLHRLGFRKLADNVDQVVASKGDGLGFNVHSFDVSGKDVFIEVKTTAWRKETSFFISRSELEFSRTNPHEFRLYRLFEFRKSPRLFDLSGAVERHCHLDPVTLVGRFS